MYSWPCAPLLARLILSRREEINGKKVLELGAGTAIPGIVAAKCGAVVTLTDREDNPLILEQLNETASLNNVQDDVRVIGVTWGFFSPGLLGLKPQDYIIASDCFYDTKDFEDVLATVSFIMEKNNNSIFWTSYQERSANRTLDHLMLRWGFQCTTISTDTISSISDLLIEGPSNSIMYEQDQSLNLWQITRIQSDCN